jgi:LysM repeat protein
VPTFPPRGVKPSPTATAVPTPEPTAEGTPTPLVSPVLSFYTVKPGDTLEEIAAKFGTTVEIIVEANTIDPETPIQPGQVLAIPLVVGGNEDN